KAVLGGFVHAATGVRDCQAYKFARGGLGVAVSIGSIELGNGGGDEQIPAIRHGVARINREIHEDLLKTAGIRIYEREVRTKIVPQRDVLPNQTAKHAADVGDQFVQ